MVYHEDRTRVRDRDPHDWDWPKNLELEPQDPRHNQFALAHPNMSRVRSVMPLILQI
jgi:hypothetical protein